MTQIIDRAGEIVGGEFPIVEIGVPDGVDGLGELLAQERAPSAGLGTVVGKREIKLEDLRGQGLDREILTGVNAERGPDQKAEHQSREQGQKPDHRADHVARTAGGEFVWQQALKDEADRPAGEHHERNRARKPLRRPHSVALHARGALSVIGAGLSTPSERSPRGQASQEKSNDWNCSRLSARAKISGWARARAASSCPVRQCSSMVRRENS